MKKVVIVRNFLFSLVLISLFTSFVSAIDTEITVKTAPNHDVSVSVLDPDYDYSLIEIFQGESGLSGEFSFTFSDEDLTSFDMKIYVRKLDVLKITERLGSFSVGGPIEVELYPPNYVPPPEVEEEITNATGANDSSDANETGMSDSSEGASGTTPGITGLAASEDTGEVSFFKNQILYFILGFLVLGAIIFTGVMKFKGQHPGSGKKINIIKLSELKSSKKGRIDDYKKAIKDAEDKIKEAQKEIKQLKTVEKVETIKKRMEADKEKLERLAEEEEKKEKAEEKKEEKKDD